MSSKLLAPFGRHCPALSGHPSPPSRRPGMLAHRSAGTPGGGRPSQPCPRPRPSQSVAQEEKGPEALLVTPGEPTGQVLRLPGQQGDQWCQRDCLANLPGHSPVPSPEPGPPPPGCAREGCPADVWGFSAGQRVVVVDTPRPAVVQNWGGDGPTTPSPPLCDPASSLPSLILSFLICKMRPGDTPC